MKRELDSLLACDAPEERLIEVPTVLDAAARGLEPEMAGRRIGAYRIIRLIGRGGMGAVYLGGRDDEQYRKQVAIKLMKRGMDTDFMLDRFQQERQILADLEHPFIARLSMAEPPRTDSHTSLWSMSMAFRSRSIAMTTSSPFPSGLRPVPPGVRSGSARAPEPGRTSGYQARQHPDAKEGIPKLLDFGLAKVFDPNRAVGITLTQREQRMLTPDYASPEQVRGAFVGTASDIYSLGAVLYELLTGQRPHRFTSNSQSAMEDAVCVAEPLRPSVAVLENESLALGLRKQLRRQLSGDLDNIVLAALRKEPQRRYASAAEFAEDLRRHDKGLPVVAQEDRWTYRAGKFIGRNRLIIGTASLVAVSLIAGIVASTIQARRAEQRFQIVRGLARTMLYDLYGEMESLPGSISLRTKTIRTVVNYLDTLWLSGSDDPALDLEIAAAYPARSCPGGPSFLLESRPRHGSPGHLPESARDL